jgi:hypothetical protein
VGSLLTMLGVCAMIDDRGENFLMVGGPILALYIFRALKEEAKLAGRFPAQWQVYAQRVPRILPRQWPKNPFRGWSWRQWAYNREYRFVAAMVLGLAVLQLWHLHPDWH